MAKPIADSAPATDIMYNPKTSANISLNCQENNKTITETASSIISIDIIINIKLFRLNIKPIVPNPNNIIAKSIKYKIYLTIKTSPFYFSNNLHTFIQIIQQIDNIYFFLNI
jgi:hypothetical protein